MRQLTIRVVVWDKDGCIESVREMKRIRKDGKRDLRTLEFFLDCVSDAKEAGKRVVMEFPDEGR